MKKNIKYAFRLSKEELDMIKENAKQYNMRLSEYMRNACLLNNVKVIKTKQVEIPPDVSINLYRTASNLNQLVRLLNLTRNVKADDIERCITYIVELQKKYEEILNILRGKKNDNKSM